MSDKAGKSGHELLLAGHDLTSEQFKSTGLKWEELDAIAADHAKREEELRGVGNLYAQRISRVTGVHSVKMRIKDPDHLKIKIIRKRLEDPNRVITIDNYRKELTDLIGVRALHLFKDDWRPIHDMIRARFNLHEEPVAHYRRGDSDELVQEFRAAGCEPKEEPAGYRSVHYVVVSPLDRETHYIEVQVRTLFEEGWAEIDHLVRYPRKSVDKLLSGFLDLFNSAASSADAMGTYLKNLNGRLAASLQEQQALARQVNEKEARVNDLVSKLKISDTEKTNLRREIAAAEAARAALFAGDAVVNPGTGTIYLSTNVLGNANTFLSLTPKGTLEGSFLARTYTCPNGHPFQSNQPVGLLGIECPVCRAVTGP